MYIPKKKSILSLALLLATQAALATSSKELLAQTKHFRIYADSSIKNKITQDDLIFLKNYLEEAYSALQAELGVDAASRCGGKLNFVLQANTGGAFSAVCTFGMSYDALHNTFNGIYRYWAYILPLHEMINSFTGVVTQGWPPVHRAECGEGRNNICYFEWWVDTRYGVYSSPFPDNMDDYILKKLGYDRIAEVHYKTTFKTPFHYVFKEILNRYGAKPFKDLLQYIVKYNIDLNMLDFKETTYTIIYFLMASTKTDLRPLFIISGIPVPTKEDIAKLDAKYGLNVLNYTQKLKPITALWINKGKWQPAAIYFDVGNHLLPYKYDTVLTMPTSSGYTSGYVKNTAINEDIQEIIIEHPDLGFNDPTFLIIGHYNSTNDNEYTQRIIVLLKHTYQVEPSLTKEIIPTTYKIEYTVTGTSTEIKSNNNNTHVVGTNKAVSSGDLDEIYKRLAKLEEEVSENNKKIAKLNNSIQNLERRLDSLQSLIVGILDLLNKIIRIFVG